MHHNYIHTLFALLISLIVSNITVGQSREVRVFGYVLDTDNRSIELANVYLEENTIIGTTTNQNGYYELYIDIQDTVTLVYSMIGYETIRQQLYTTRDVIGINVILPTNEELLNEVTVNAIQRQTNSMDRVDIGTARLMPDATGGSIESLLITFAGVSQNNEMSSQYNVRGGSFDENSVYVNGLEVHRPLLIRSGQQEGLSFVNPDMVESVDFSAGGFDAKYGDKMSSVLDIQYKRPTRLESRLSMSLLGASGYIGWGDSTHSQMHGIRYKTSRYLLGTLETQGNYNPNYIDYQTQMTWRLKTRKEKPLSDVENTWDIKLQGNLSQNSYEFSPESSETPYGLMNQPLNIRKEHIGQERDMFRTAFAALSIHHQLSRTLRLGIDLSGFYTHEQETFDIDTEYVLSEQPADDNESPNYNNGEELSNNTSNSAVLGTGHFHEHARNTLQAGMITLAHTGQWKSGENTLQWGVSGQAEFINDRISEWEWRDSMGYSMPNLEKEMALYYALKGTTTVRNGRIQAYAQDSYRWHTESGNILLTGGIRFNWWSFTNEILPSPRVSVTWIPAWKRDFTFRAAAGLYYQAPFYKELRQVVIDEGAVNRVELNKDLRAQRSWQIVLGTDYYFRAWGRPFKFTTEAYGKYMDRLESYTAENVRIRYSGNIDSKGYTVGLDLKLMGELVPGADSWISFSTMRSRMRFIEDKHELGWIPMPQEQRYNLTIYFQDYLPRFPQYKLHLKFIWSEGMPYGYPHNEKMRYLGHMSDYRRIDIGATRTFSSSNDKWMKKSKHVDSWSVQLDVFNLIGWKNVNSYYWVTDANNMQWRTPNYLTGRMINLKFDIMIK